MGFLVRLLATGQTGTFHTAQGSSTWSLYWPATHRLWLIWIGLGFLSANLCLSSVHLQTLRRCKISSLPGLLFLSQPCFLDFFPYRAGMASKSLMSTQRTAQSGRKSLPLQTNPRKRAYITHSVPSVSQHSWQGPRSGEDTGSAWTPEFQEPFHQLPAGATDIAMETITTATSSKGSEIGVVIQDSGYEAAQPQNRNHPQAPIPWEGTHREASRSVATLHMLGGENPSLHTPRPRQKATMVFAPFEVHTTKSALASVRLAQRKKSPQEIFQECCVDEGLQRELQSPLWMRA